MSENPAADIAAQVVVGALTIATIYVSSRVIEKVFVRPYIARQQKKLEKLDEQVQN